MNKKLDSMEDRVDNLKADQAGFRNGYGYGRYGYRNGYGDRHLKGYGYGPIIMPGDGNRNGGEREGDLKSEEASGESASSGKDEKDLEPEEALGDQEKAGEEAGDTKEADGDFENGSSEGSTDQSDHVGKVEETEKEDDSTEDEKEKTVNKVVNAMNKKLDQMEDRVALIKSRKAKEPLPEVESKDGPSQARSREGLERGEIPSDDLIDNDAQPGGDRNKEEGSGMAIYSS